MHRMIPQQDVTYRLIGVHKPDLMLLVSPIDTFILTARHHQLYKQAVQILTATATQINKMSVIEFNGKVSYNATNMIVFGKYFIVMRLYLLVPTAYSLVTNRVTKRPSH